MDALNHRNNSFDLVRFIAAVSVLISHHFALSGFEEPYVPVMRASLGATSVAVFFVISGYLIYGSLQRSNRWDAFFAARFLRIMPNLTCALVLSSGVMLLWFANYSNLSSHIDYVVHNMGMFFHGAKARIPGVLDGQPSRSINGSFWTLPYEFWLYVALFCIFLTPARLRLATLLVAALGANAIYLWIPESERIFFLRWIYIGKLGLYFLSGALVAALWPLIVRRCQIAACCAIVGIAVARLALPGESLLFTLSLAVLIIVISKTSIFAAFGRYGDASYGIYIFAFPVQQLSIYNINSFWLSMTVALVITVVIGYATWHTFEERCLRFKPQLASFLSGRGIRGAWLKKLRQPQGY
jgi:peptidoglycan/LPS O-acetylase OafA/YrhL